MALGAIIAPALQGSPIGAGKSVYLAGVNVRPPIGTVQITEAGPGSVSSATFTIEDTGNVVSISDGMDVRIHDLTNNRPLFLGWVQAFSVIPDFGQQGRRIEVTAVGVEAVLDWALTTSDLTFPALSIGTTYTVETVIQMIVANSTGAGPLRSGAGSAFPSGEQANPVGNTWTYSNPASFSIPTGTTVREAIRTVFSQRAGEQNGALVTVDFTYGLRAWADSDLTDPSDYLDATVNNIPGGTDVSESLAYSIVALDIPRAVVVRGASLVVVVTGASGKMGPVAGITDTNLTTTTAAQAAGRAYLAAFRSGLRGQYQRTDWSPPGVGPWVYAGSLVVITDARAGLSSSTFRIMQIDKTFNPSGRENWSISFGGAAPSGAALMRRLTRATLS